MTTWTSRAWTDSNRDWFERNLVETTVGTGDGAEARAYNASTVNGPGRTWPTLDEVLRWDRQNAYPGITGQLGSADPEVVQLALDAAIEMHAERCHLHVRPVDADGAVDEAGDPVAISAKVKLATIMRAVRLARRQFTPDGIAGASEIGGVIRTTAFDSDIESLLGGETHLGLA